MKNVFLFLLMLFGFQMAFSQDACDTKEMRAFDFWLGRWLVYQDGEVVGSSIIRRSPKDCGIDESWKSNNGQPGTSHNFYNPSTEKWEQHWVDASGWELDLYGNPVEENTMVLKSDTVKDWEGKESLHKISWKKLPMGAIIQTWSASYDGGETWTEIFKGQYERAF